tara:strand:+ start:4001 stop:4714 length:714 start_codon:yes stop_codon:yes gene_type:complete
MNKKLIVSSILAIAFLSTTVAPAVVSATDDHPVEKQVINKPLIKDDKLKPKTLKKFKEKPRTLKVLKKVKKKRLLYKAKPAERKKFRKELKERKLKIKKVGKKHRTDFRKKIKSTKKRARLAAAHRRAFHMLKRFHFANARYSNIIERIERRIKKLEANDVDVTSLVVLLEEAKNLQAETEDKLASVKEKYESLLTGDSPKEAAMAARALAKELKGDLKSIHAKVVELIKALKALKK